jgi:hypothetical protein
MEPPIARFHSVEKGPDMSETPVLAQSPISFNQGGNHFMIPLSAIYFDDSGALKANRWPLYSTHSAAVDRLLTRLKREGVLRAGQQPAAKPAFTATAITAGATVLIEIEIANVVPDTGAPPNSKADFKVTETDTYTEVETAKLKDIVGVVTGGGKRPGLVFVDSAAAPELPKAGPYAMTAAAAGDPGTVAVLKNTGAGPAFSLQTRANGPDAILTAIEIKDVDVPSSKFTLIAKWTKSANAQAMTGLAGAFVYVVTIAAPAGGFLAPAAGKVVLAGGSDAVAIDAVKASATILAK